MNTTSKPCTTLRRVIHFLLLLLFAFGADTIMVAHTTRIWRYTPPFVWMGGGLVYIILVFLLRWIAPDFWLVKK